MWWYELWPTVMPWLLRLIHSQTKTSGQSNLTTGRIADAHGRFNGIRQVAPLCTPPNTCFLGPTRVQMPNGISIGSAVFEQLTADSRCTLQRPFPLKLPFPTGDLTTIHVPWAHPGPQPKRHLDRFSRFCRAHYCDRLPDRPTDHATRSVTIGRIGVCMRTARQPNNTILLLLFEKVLEFSVYQHVTLTTPENKKTAK